MSTNGNHTTVTPHLTVRNAAAAIDYYTRAFGAEEITRMTMPGASTVMHAELRIGGARLYLNDEFPSPSAGDTCRAPQSIGGSPVTLHLSVDDVDAAFVRAVAAGGKAKMPPTDMFWGDRYCKLQDPFGHEWSLATNKESLTPEQIRERATQWFEKKKG